MRIHTNTNTIYQRWCKSWSLRQLVQPLFSWFSCLPMTTSVWQVWRSLRHKEGCTFRQSLRLWIRWVRHRSWTWTESYSFVIVLGHGQNHILSNKTIHKLDVTSRLLLWKQEGRMCETIQFSHRLLPAMVLVRTFLAPTESDDDTGALFCVPLPPSPHLSSACPVKTHEFQIQLFFALFYPAENPAFFSPFLWGWTLSQDTRKSRWSRVGTSKIILDFYHVICLVRWIMDRLGKVGREVVKKLDYHDQWYFPWVPPLDYQYQWYMQKPALIQTSRVIVDQLSILTRRYNISTTSVRWILSKCVWQQRYHRKFNGESTPWTPSPRSSFKDTQRCIGCHWHTNLAYYVDHLEIDESKCLWQQR
jgi:hypothetical protein